MTPGPLLSLHMTLAGDEVVEVESSTGGKRLRVDERCVWVWGGDVGIWNDEGT